MDDMNKLMKQRLEKLKEIKDQKKKAYDKKYEPSNHAQEI